MFGKEEINSVFFDLDGTLLPIDLDDFLEKYFGALTGEFSDLAESDKLVKILMKSTEAMIENDGSKTNKEVFMDSFFSLLNAKNRSRTMKRFEEFYRTTYPRLRHK
ncbi:MAG: HAD family hydrolase, partial [Halanaerobiales bacterium]